jgi:hypothetical protein
MAIYTLVLLCPDIVQIANRCLTKGLHEICHTDRIISDIVLTGRKINSNFFPQPSYLGNYPVSV